MSGAAMPSAQAVAGVTPSGMNLGPEQQQNLQKRRASEANSQRVELAAQRLAVHVLQPSRQNVKDFFSLCLSLSRGIDYAVANNEVPPKAQNLPSLLRKICQRKNDIVLQAAIMVLMFSVKSACKIGWFSSEEAQELLALADEIGNGFLGPSINGNLLSTVSTIMTRFYPLMKMGQILASLEVEPGYGAFMTDFHISKNMVHSTQEKIRLFVAQTDNIETSACVISPQQANFILNGKGVDRRTNVFMDTGPLLPTNVSPMLKYGTNLLQAVGQFNGRYVIIVAVMSMASSVDSPMLQDYVQSGFAMQDSDSDVIEGPSRISLNCPISYTRIKTPVKGHSCKHLQCFDFSNFVHINSRRPSWRCPHCNQHVCYTDIRVDQNIVKVLSEVGENATDVIISADGSWKAIMENDDNVDQAHDKIRSCEKEGCEDQESPGIANSDPVILDLTKDDDEMDIVSTGVTEDRKPDLQSQPVTTNLTLPSELNNTVPANQNDVITDDDFWSGIFYPDGFASSGSTSDAQTVGGISVPTSSNFMMSPVLTDAISPALNREVEALGYAQLTNPVMQSLYFAPNNLQLQQTQLVNPSVNHEYGRSSVTRHQNRTPIAVQALPATSPHGVNNMEQQQFSRSHVNTFSGPDMASSPFSPHSAAQAVGLQASSALHNLHQQQQQALNLRTPPSMSQSPSMIQSSSPRARTPTQQGSAQVGPGRTLSNVSRQHPSPRLGSAQVALARAQLLRQPPTVPVQVQTPSAGPRYPTTADGVRGSVRNERENGAGPMQSVRADSLTDLPEQNWRPTGRMRGSLSGKAYSDALNSHMVILPTNPPTLTARPQSSPAPHPPAQPARPQSSPASHPPAQPARPQLSPAPHLSVPPHLQAFRGNSNTRLPHLQTNPVTDLGSMNGGSGTQPDRSLGN